jgi:hypothetical protein
MSVSTDEIHALVEKYLAEYPDEAGRLARLGGALTGPGEPAGHITSAVVLIDPHWRVLHLHYRDPHCWLLPEAHLTERDGSVPDAGLRGLYERLGIERDTVSPLPGFEVTPIDIHAHRRPLDRTAGRAEHWHFEVRHAFRTAGTPFLRLRPEDPAEPTWLGVDAVPGFALRLKLRLLNHSLAEDTGV